MRTPVRIALVLLLVAIVSATAGFLHYRGLYRAPGPLTADKAVVIDKGIGVSRIADLLQREGVIDRPLVFRLGLRHDGLAGALKAGEYLFSAGISMRETAALIASGKTVVRRLTIAEGLTARQVIGAVRMAEGMTGEIADAAAEEGAFLPETYFYSWGDSRKDMLGRMRASMTATLARLWPTRDPSVGFRDPRDALVLASVIEKETGRAGERAKISAVFHNRLKRGMRLQSDPTVVYAIAGGEGTLGRALTRADLAVDSPYNTYVVSGLPPGPISNPGVASIEAALHPARSDDLYFVADGTGGHVFARTLSGHNRNVARYRRLLRQRKQVP